MTKTCPKCYYQTNDVEHDFCPSCWYNYKTGMTLKEAEYNNEVKPTNDIPDILRDILYGGQDR